MKIHLTPKEKADYVYHALSVIIFCAVASVSIFLYNNFYTTTQDAKKILFLADKDIKKVNINKFNLILTKLEQKTYQNEITDFRNPFEKEKKNQYEAIENKDVEN